MRTLNQGDMLTFQRTFTKKDVELFINVSGDDGAHHQIPDEAGRFIVQGHLTATLPTKIGGDYDVLARTMNFEFLRPVFTGDTITCDVLVDQSEQDEKNRTNIATSFTCRNQEGKPVMEGRFAGVIV